ncbi:MAG: carboxypeptidase regulatory-like domain-containing protein [Bacteroidetes bacterium]|nr:carboxypeptidase regulatory-like domain-containing protein [Bacteroidota bacterium]MBU1115447.1 carboxypeptidase regulatory-like domain-containing protein [Bacteroidota bacterium]MBU1797590.1 carboxypeptidase regulatory-like domain-containing protein [Bacteroidota bacterium]
MKIHVKTKTIVSLLFIFAILLILGCNDEITNNYNTTDGRVIGSIHGVVTDANTNTRIFGVEVTTVVNGKVFKTLTDSLGYYSITNLSTGDYEISYSGKKDFAIGRTTVSIPTLQQIGITEFPTSEDFHYSEKMDIDLYMLNAGLTGKVWTKFDDENTIIASGVMVIADFSNYDISPDKYITTTNSDGSFTFNNLPATGNVELITMPYNNGISNYSVNSTSAILLPNIITNANNIILSIAQESPFVVQNNFKNNNFNLYDDIILTFSKEMEPSSFYISLSSTTFGTVEYEATWNSSNITLSINPFVALQVNETYYLTINGKSKDNNLFSESFTFGTKQGIQFVKTNLERTDGIFDEFSIFNNIEITFSENVDLNNKDGYVYLIDENSEIGQTTNSISPQDTKTLVINPIENMKYDHNYTLSYKVYSTYERDYASGLISFRTKRN